MEGLPRSSREKTTKDWGSVEEIQRKIWQIGEDWVGEEEVANERSAPRTPEPNEAAEGSEGVMITRGRAIQTDAHLPEDMWPEAMEAAERFPNQPPTVIIEGSPEYPYQSGLYTTAKNKYGDLKRQNTFQAITCADVAFIAATLSEFLQNPCPHHQGTVNRELHT